MDGYTWVAHSEVVEELFALSADDRKVILKHFYEISASPGHHKVQSFTDEDGDILHFSPIGSWVVAFRVDEAIREVHFLAVE